MAIIATRSQVNGPYSDDHVDNMAEVAGLALWTITIKLLGPKLRIRNESYLLS
jgi:hypothetical protein